MVKHTWRNTIELRTAAGDMPKVLRRLIDHIAHIKYLIPSGSTMLLEVVSMKSLRQHTS
jgi:hypothetical protein